MTHYVQQFGEHFFVLIKLQGYDRYPFIHGTKITADEYKKLYYSGERERIKSVIPTTRTTRFRIKGNASNILGREVQTITGKEIKSYDDIDEVYGYDMF